jgi:hypothetical protein
MNPQRQLEELERVAGELAVRVCYEPMAGLVQGIGGLCKVRGEYRVIIDRRLRAPERVNILADALRRFDTSRIELGDAMRRMLEPALVAVPGAILGSGTA